MGLSGGWRGPGTGEHRRNRQRLRYYPTGRGSEEKFNLSAKDDQLTISYQEPDTEANIGPGEAGRYTYQEFGTRSFKRTFQLKNKVMRDSISTTYADGILSVTLPKNPETTKPTQAITVA